MMEPDAVARKGRRVCIVTEGYYGRDGVGRSILAKVRMLEGLGHAVSVVMPAPHFLTMPGQDARVRFLSLRDVLIQASDGVREDFLSHDLYIYEYPTYYELVESHRLLAEKRVIFDYYGLTPPEFFTEDAHRASIEHARSHLPILEEAHLVLVHSDASRRELQRFAAVPDAKIRSIPLALDPAHVQRLSAERRDRARRDLGLEDRFVLLFVGRMAGNKGLPTLVEGLAATARDIPGALLMIAGADRAAGYDVFRDRTLARARELGVADRIRITGSLSEDELLDAYAASDVVVTASLHEGFGLPVAEALACGRPVVVTDATALPETAGPGALLFPPGDAAALAAHVVALAQDPHLYKAQVERGLSMARAYHPDAVAAGLSGVIEAVLALEPRPLLNRFRLLQIAASLQIWYEDKCGWPILGFLVSFVRHKLTLHLEKFFVRPLQKNFQIVARLVTQELADLKAQVARLEAEVARLRVKLDRHDRANVTAPSDRPAAVEAMGAPTAQTPRGERPTPGPGRFSAQNLPGPGSGRSPRGSVPW